MEMKNGLGTNQNQTLYMYRREYGFELAK